MPTRHVLIAAAVLSTLTACVRYEDGAAAFDRKDYPKAFSQWQLLAKFGEARAQNELGWLYQQGLGVDPDPALAAHWYRKAAVQGLAVAQTNLGLMYREGAGVTLDRREAARWFELAARQGDAAALNNLGVLFDAGEGVPEDNARAASLLRQAADRGHPKAMNNLGLLYRQGEGVPQDLAEAARWFQRSADRGDREGMNNLAVMLDNGFGVTRDAAAARDLFERAARAGEPAAALNFAKVLLRELAERPGAGPRAVSRKIPPVSAKAGAVVDTAAKSDSTGSPSVVAYAWLNVAASHGLPEAYSLREDFSKQLTADEIALAQAKSASLLGAE